MAKKTLGLRVALWGHDGTTFSGYLSDVVSLECSWSHSDSGGLKVSIPRASIGAAALMGSTMYWAAVEVQDPDSGRWSEPQDSRFMVLSWDSSDIGHGTDIVQFTFASPRWLLTRAVWRSIGAGERSDERQFAAATAGQIMRTALTEASTRGALPKGVSYSSFTDSVDSAGKPWSQAMSIAYKVGGHAQGALESLVSAGLCVPRWDGLSLKLYDGDGVSKTGARPRLSAGRDITEAPVKTTRGEVATVALVRGDDGVMVEVESKEGVGRWGRLETTVDAGGVTDPGALRAIGQRHLEIASEQREEHTHGLALIDADYWPMVDYTPGDYVTSVTDGGVRDYRVRSITLTLGAGGVVSGNAVLNDRIAEWEERVSRAVTGGGSTGVQGGSGAMPRPTGPTLEGDSTIPTAPVGLQLTSDVYDLPVSVGRGTWATIKASWVDPAVNTDGTPVNDLREIEFDIWSTTDPAWSVLKGGGRRVLTSVPAGQQAGAWSPFLPGHEYVIRARAVDKVGHLSEWSEEVRVITIQDKTPPPTPSTPRVVTRMGVAVVSWDGKGALGEGLPADWDHAEVWVEYVKPTGERVNEAVGSIIQGSMESVIVDLPYETPISASLVSVDQSGNKSRRGDGVGFTVDKLVDTNPQISEIDASRTKIINANLALVESGKTLDAYLNEAFSTHKTAAMPTVSSAAPTPADGTAAPTGAMWTRIDGSGAVVAMYRWTGSAWVNLPFSATVVPKIDIGSGTVGVLDVARLSVSSATVSKAVVDKLWVDVVRSRQITADMVSIGGGPNLFIDPAFTNQDVSKARLTQDASNPGRMDDTRGMVFNIDGRTPWEITLPVVSGDSSDIRNYFPVAYGQELLIEALVELTRASVDVNVSGSLIAKWVDSSGKVTPVGVAAMTGDPQSNSLVSSGWGASLSGRKTLRGTLKVPPKAVGVMIGVGGQGTGKDVSVARGVRVYDRVRDSLIVDGAINATHLAAESVTSAAIKAGSITGDAIAANTITAAKIASGSITGEKIAGNAIDGKTITGATIRTSTGYPRVEMTPFGFSAFNLSGLKTFGIDGTTGNVSAVGDFKATSYSDPAVTTTLTGNAFGGQPGVKFTTDVPREFQGALVAKVAKDANAGYVPGSIVLHGAEQNLNSTGRTELVLAPDGGGVMLKTWGGPFKEVMYGSNGNDLLFGGRLGNNSSPVFDAYQDNFSSLAGNNSMYYTRKWAWPDGGETYQVVTTSAMSPTEAAPKLFATLSAVTRDYARVAVLNLGSTTLSNISVYVNRVRKSRL